VRCQAKLELARLVMERGMVSASLTGSLQLLDALLAAPGCDREQQAEALFLKAETYAKIGHIQAVLPLYAQVISQHPEEGSWADLAVSRVLDRSLAGAGERFEDKAQALTLLSEQYRQSLPKLSLGALNRLGDVYFAADERARAKDAYRQCIARAKSVPQAGTQLAAARMALAEILYLEERFHRPWTSIERKWPPAPSRTACTGWPRRRTCASPCRRRLPAARGRGLIGPGDLRRLLRDDPSFVPAHRGMIRASAALRTIPATVAEYRTRLAQQPDDATLLYATGLALTYQDGKAPLLEAPHSSSGPSSATGRWNTSTRPWAMWTRCWRPCTRNAADSNPPWSHTGARAFSTRGSRIRRTPPTWT
jgi:tetratricopeptide (TPR) repeat protein